MFSSLFHCCRRRIALYMYHILHCTMVGLRLLPLGAGAYAACIVSRLCSTEDRKTAYLKLTYRISLLQVLGSSEPVHLTKTAHLFIQPRNNQLKELAVTLEHHLRQF